MRKSTISRVWLTGLLVSIACNKGAIGPGDSQGLDGGSDGGDVGGDPISGDPGGGDASPGDPGGGDTSPGDVDDTCTVSSGEAFYVAPSDQDEEGAGTLADPFKHIQYAFDQTDAGDTVFVRAGTYFEQVTLGHSGAPGAPITVRSYCGERAILDGTGTSGSGEPALFTIEGESHLVVRGFELRNLTGGFPAGIWVRGSATDIVLRDNIIHDITASNGGDNSGAHGIGVYGRSSTPAEGIAILDNELYNLVLGWSEALVINGNVRDFQVIGNSVHDVNNIAYVFIGFEGECSSCTDEDVVDVANVDRARDGQISDNTAYNVSSAGNPAYGSEKSAGCFYVDGGARLVIERNMAHHCDLGIELASEHAGKSTRAITVRNNFFYQNDVTGIATGGYSSGTGSGGGSATDCFVVNNTIYDSSLDGWADTGILLQNRNQNNIYKNNIIVATSGHDAAKVDEDSAFNSGNVFDYNIYWRGSLAGATDGGHSKTEDPQLVQPGSGNLHIQSGSPAENAGENLSPDVSGATDIDGDLRAQGTIDIGADEL